MFLSRAEGYFRGHLIVFLPISTQFEPGLPPIKTTYLLHEIFLSAANLLKRQQIKASALKGLDMLWGNQFSVAGTGFVVALVLRFLLQSCFLLIKLGNIQHYKLVCKLWGTKYYFPVRTFCRGMSFI